MVAGGGFGPSTRRLVEASEPFENRKIIVKSMPPAIGALAFVGAFLCFIFGTTLFYENEEILGSALLVSAVALIAAPIILTFTNKQKKR